MPSGLFYAASISKQFTALAAAKRAEQEIAPFVYAGAALLSPKLFEGAPDGAFSLTRLFDRAATTYPARLTPPKPSAPVA